MPAWTFHKPNRELRFSVKFFKQDNRAVAKIDWLKGIKRGDSVNPGTELAELTWDDGSIKMLTAPPGCEGVIGRVNRNIDFLELDKHPSEWALWLSAPSTGNRR